MLRPSTFAPILPGRPVYYPLPQCSVCDGERRMLRQGKQVTCDCVLLTRAKNYLTPMLENLPDIRAGGVFDPSGLEEANVLIQNGGRLADKPFNRNWRAVLKAHLMHNKFRIPFLVCSGAQGVVDALFRRYRGDDETGSELDAYGQLESVQLLVLYLVGDPKNDRYATDLPALLRHRVAQDLQTWVVTAFDVVPNDKTLRNTYGMEFANYIRPRAAAERPEMAGVKPVGEWSGAGAGDFRLLDLAPVHAAFMRTPQSVAA